MPITPAAAGIQPIDFPTFEGGSVAKSAPADTGFGDKLAQSIDNLQQTQATADELSVQVATGQLTDIHDYMIAATKAEIATQLTVAVRNKAVESFNSIMNMQV